MGTGKESVRNKYSEKIRVTTLQITKQYENSWNFATYMINIVL